MLKRAVCGDAKLETRQLRCAEIDGQHMFWRPCQQSERVVSSTGDGQAPLSLFRSERLDQDIRVFPALGIANFRKVYPLGRFTLHDLPWPRYVAPFRARHQVLRRRHHSTNESVRE